MNKKILNYLLNYYKKKLTILCFETWVKPIKILKIKNNILWLEVPSEIHKIYWEKNLISNFSKLTFEITGLKLFPYFIINKNNNIFFQQNNMLIQKYSFETFIIGKGNQMAHAAALVVSENPGTIYNPLFFYSGVGLGKTHLLHAIGNQLFKKNNNSKIKYISSETFTNEFINSIQTKTTNNFRNEYRNLDLLLIDDIQFLAEKEATLEEFFHTFNDLYNKNKQIVLTSDRPPQNIPKLPERLVSRFAWGLSVDITPPDLETRIAILRKKANMEKIEIFYDTLDYIARQIDTNIRELEGALLRVQAYSTIIKKDITTDLAANALKSLIKTKNKKNPILKIQEIVSNFYNIKIKDIKSKKRIKNIIFPRQIAMYLSRKMTDFSLPEIGKFFGGKDHSTVIHSCEKIKNLIINNENLKIEIENIKKKINNF